MGGGEASDVRQRRDDLVAHLLLLAAVLAVGWPVLAGGTLYYGDITLQFVPWRAFARAEMLRGVLPLWLPDVYCGTPFLANDQSALLYSFHLLALPLSAPATIALGYLLHLYLSAAGGYAFARRLGRSPAAALVAGLSYGLGGYVVSKHQFPSLAYTIAWLPWLFWAARRLQTEPGPRSLVLAAGVVALQWLSGHAQMSVMQLALATLWVVAAPEARPRPWRAWLGAVALGTGLALGQLLPTFELLRLSPRASFDVAEAARFNLPPWQVLSLLLPRLFGSPAGRLPYVGVGPFWEMAWFVGLTTVILALSVRRAWFWWSIAVVGLLLACGRYLVIYGVAAQVLPVLRLFHDPARFTLYPLFALTVLAAAGYDQAPAVARQWAASLAALLGVLLLTAVALPNQAAVTLAGRILAASPSKQVGDLTALALAWRDEAAMQATAAVVVLALAWWLLGSPHRRLLVGLLAVELISQAGGLNPTVARSAFADPRPPGIPHEGLIYVSEVSLTRGAYDCFDWSHYAGPGCLADTRRTLTPNLTVATGTRQVAGYDPLRPRAVVDWLTSLRRLSVAEQDAILASLGVLGRFEAPAWRAYAAPAGEARMGGLACSWIMPTPQRRWVEAAGAGRLEVTQTRFPGWRAQGATPLAGGSAVVSVWQVDRRGTVRLRYEPVTYRVAVFASLVVLASLAGLLALSHFVQGSSVLKSS